MDISLSEIRTLFTEAVNELASLINVGVIKRIANAENQIPSIESVVKFGNDLGKSLNGATTEVIPLIVGFHKLAYGTDAATAGLELFKAGLRSVGLDKLSGPLGEFGKVILNQKNNMDVANKEFGIGSNNIGKFIQLAGESGLTTEQFNSAVRNAGPLLSGLANNAQRGAEIYAKVNQEVIQSPFGQQLISAGVSLQELADINAVSLQTRMKTDLTDINARKKAVESALDFAKELDDAAKATGQSREKILKTYKDEQEKINVIALKASMNPTQLAAFEQTQQRLAKFGPAYESLLTEIASGGARTKQGIEQMAALGPAGTELQQAYKMMSSAVTEDQKIAAKSALDRAEAAILERQTDKNFLAGTQIANEAQKEARLQMIGTGQVLQAFQKSGLSATEFIKQMGEEGNAQRLGLQLDEKGRVKTDDKGKALEDQGTKTSMLLNEANRQAAIQAGGLAINLAKVNEVIGSSPIFKKFTDRAGMAETMDEAALSQKKAIFDPLNDLVKKLETIGEKTPDKTETVKPKPPEPPPVVETVKPKPPEPPPVVETVKPKPPEPPPSVDIKKTINDTIGSKTIEDALPKKEPIQKFGEVLNKLTAEIQSGGLKTKESLEAMDKLGPVGIDFAKSVQMMIEAKTEEQKATAKAALDKVQIDATSKLASTKPYDMWHPAIINDNPADWAAKNQAPKTTEVAANSEKNKAKNEEKEKEENEKQLKKDNSDLTKQVVDSTPANKDATLNELKDQLMQLNKSIGTLISYTQETASNTSKIKTGAGRFNG